VTTPSPDPDQPYEKAPPPPPPPPGYSGYGQPGAPYQQAGPPVPGEYATGPLMTDPDQRMWATLAHLSGLLFGFLGPLVIYLLMKDRGRFIRSQALEALNFQITVLIAVVVSAALILVVIGLFLLPIVGGAAFVLMILAAIAANRGEEYRYPLTLRLVS
jgi:uncharacterized Tic20 family protein